MFNNLVLKADSYKFSQWSQYPEHTSNIFSYGGPRGGEYDDVMAFGTQALIKKHFMNPITRYDVEEANEFIQMHGEPFNYDGWMGIVKKHSGWLPLEIKAIPEGMIVPTKNVMFTIENTDDEFAWLTSCLETIAIRGHWYPSTVGTTSYRIAKIIKKYLEETGDPSLLPFKLHDFGMRGVSSEESAALGGIAHLISFRGTDNLDALIGAKAWYNMKTPAGFSIPASEHSTITSWGKQHEFDAYANMVRNFGGPGKTYACVSDSFDILNAVKSGWGGELKQLVLDTGGTLVVRPDSGDPTTIVLKVIQILDEKFGSTVNTKGFKVLHPAVRVIQGDGVNELSIEMILMTLKAHGYSADNVAFGMGGALLQAIDRDTCKWAMKCSAAKVKGAWIDVFKDPVTDKGKSSLKGRVTLVKNKEDKFETKRISEMTKNDTEVLRTVYKNGELLIDESLDFIRTRLVI